MPFCTSPNKRQHAQVRDLHQLLMFSPGLIQRHLHTVFRKLMVYQKLKLSASGQDIGGGNLFTRAMGFSGTPDVMLPAGMCDPHLVQSDVSDNERVACPSF